MRILLAVLLLALPAHAAEWEMRLAGVPVGTATLSGSGTSLQGQASSQGVARAFGAYAWAGRRAGGAYEEVERLRGEERRTRLAIGDAVAVLEVPAGETPLDPATTRGATDPLTAMSRLLRDRPAAEACALSVRFTDGIRMGAMRLAPGGADGEAILCRGTWERLAGPPPADGRERRRSAGFTVRLAPAAGDVLRVVEVSAPGPLGRFVLRRR